MNVTYKCSKGNAFICADGVSRMMASYKDVEELLICENLIELLSYYRSRDVKELNSLTSKKRSLDRSSLITGAYAVSASLVPPLLSVCNILSPELAGGLSVGVLSTGAVICTLNKHVLPHNNLRKGLSECVNYEEQKIDELKVKIEEIRKNSPVFKEEMSEQLVDDREAKKRLIDVLNFVFYMGINKDKVYSMFNDITLQKFLREKMKITDIKTIIEIEKYVYYAINNKKEKDMSYGLK